MRNVFRALLDQADNTIHAGLAYDRYTPIVTGSDNKENEFVQQWLEKLEKQPIPSDYKDYYQRWEQALERLGAYTFRGTFNSRLLVGHGNPSPTQVGLTLHHTWGVPVIPGSALKGLLNHYIQIVYGPTQPDRHPQDYQENTERERARYQGVLWKGNHPIHGPGDIHRILFGAPPTESDETHHGSGETQGYLTFHDAVWVAGNQKQPFLRDVITVHQQEYYTKAADSVRPNDYEDPIPISFLSVRPESPFLFAITGPQEWAKLAGELLQEALRGWGVGAKTAAGYGMLR